MSYLDAANALAESKGAPDVPVIEAEQEKEREVPPNTFIPLALLCRRDLTAAAKVVVAAKIYTEHPRVRIEGEIVAVLCQLTGLSPSKVKGALTELSDAGILLARNG